MTTEETIPYYKQVISDIENNRNNHLQGYYNCIPFIGMQRLEQFIPGIEQETYYLVTANSGIGKSKFVRYLFIHNPYEYIRTHPDCGIELKIIYFSLEESKKKVILSEISKYLFTKYNIPVNIKQLQSRGRYNTISAETLEKVKEAEEYIEQFLNVVDIVDSVRNPTGMYKYVRNYAMQVGRYYDVHNQPLSDAEHLQINKGEGDVYKKVAYYKKYNPKLFVIVITDHLKLMSGESTPSGMYLSEGKPVMNKWSSDYCLIMRDKWGFSPVNVQQQASDKEKQEYTMTGKSIEEKLEPTLDGLGEHKLTQQDANIVLGLFAPERYGIREHNGYDINFFKDNYRSMSILMDRDGEANKKLPLFFNGATDFFRELPLSSDIDQIRIVREYVNSLRSR